MNEKYTICFNNGQMSGSHYLTIPTIHRIEFDNTITLGEIINKFYPNVWWIFEGWPILEGELKDKHGFHPVCKLYNKETENGD
jgi:hypothetical protein